MSLEPKMVVAVIVVALGLGAGWFLDRRRWRSKTREQLAAMLQDSDWRYYKMAIRELRRRGEDVSVHLPRLVGMLVADSRMERGAAKVILGACFPELAGELKDFSPTASLEVCRARAAPLLERFGVRR